MRGTLKLERPFPEWALPKLWAWMEACRSRIADDFAPKTFDEFLEVYVARSGETWGVLRTGEDDDGDTELGGWVSIREVNPVCVESHLVFAKRFWGHETTVPALRSIYQGVFEERPELLKITAAVFEDNRQMIELALAVGAVEETSPKHPLRACTLRGGVPVGMRVVSIFREDFLCHS